MNMSSAQFPTGDFPPHLSYTIGSTTGILPYGQFPHELAAAPQAAPKRKRRRKPRPKPTAMPSTRRAISLGGVPSGI